MAKNRLAYPVRLAIVSSIVTFVFVGLSFLKKNGSHVIIEIGIPFSFHHSDSIPSVLSAMDSDNNRFIPVGIFLDLFSYLFVSALILRFFDSSRAKRIG